MSFVWNTQESDIENIKRYVDFIIQTIENNKQPVSQVLDQLVSLKDRIRNMR